MSSNLTISYTSQTAAGIAPAGAPAAAADAPAADSPLGFLAALVDQLLSGGGQAPAAADTASVDTAISTTVPSIINLAIAARTEPKPSAQPQQTDLVADLSKQLDALKANLSAGTQPAPEQLQQLSDTIDALTNTVAAPTSIKFEAAAAPTQPAPDAAPAAPTTTPSDTAPVDQILQLLASLGLIKAEPQPAEAPTTTPEAAPTTAALVDKLHDISQSVAATAPALAQKLEALATTLSATPPLAAQLTAAPPSPDALKIAKIVRALLGNESAQSTDNKPDAPASLPAVQPPSATQDQLLQILTTLGVATTPTTVATPSASPTDTAVTTAVPPTLVRLSAQLSQLSGELAATSPDFAKKLDAVATKLVSTDANPELQAQLTSAVSDQDGTGLDKLIQTLIDNKPAAPTAPAAPQIAATAELKIPTAIATPKTKAPVSEVNAAAIVDEAPAIAPAPTLRVSTAAPIATPVEHDVPVKPEAKLATDIADAVKTDVAATTPAPAPAAQQVPTQIARALPAAYQQIANPINMGQVAFEMVHQIHQGASRFTIRLDPPELGRVDVKMHVDQSGTVNARLVVDRAETLDLFQRDQRSLERALAQAGLEGGKTNLEFSLRQNPFAGMTGGDQRPQPNPYGTPARFASGESDDDAIPAVTLYRGTASAGGVNLFV